MKTFTAAKIRVDTTECTYDYAAKDGGQIEVSIDDRGYLELIEAGTTLGVWQTFNSVINPDALVSDDVE